LPLIEMKAHHPTPAMRVRIAQSGILKGLRPLSRGAGDRVPCRRLPAGFALGRNAGPSFSPSAAHTMRRLSGIPKGLRPFGGGAGGSAPCAFPLALLGRFEALEGDAAFGEDLAGEVV